MGQYEKLFFLAAKVGCLEGYLYQRPDAEPKYFDNWLGNIQRLYGELPPDIKKEATPEFLTIMKKVADHATKILEDGHRNRVQIDQIIAEAEK